MTNNHNTHWKRLNRAIVQCERCPRLREHCKKVASVKRRAFQNWDYWGNPVPNFGDPSARLLVVGLAPAAHGANRTGRMFTGDRSGDWLFRALHRAAFANQQHAYSTDDRLRLIDCMITATCHCAPPKNKPTREEIEHCLEWLQRTFDFIPAHVFLALGRIAWSSIVGEAKRRNWIQGKLPRFAHGAAVAMAKGRWLVGSYHPSQQNTFTGRLTEAMFDDVFNTCRELLEATD